MIAERSLHSLKVLLVALAALFSLSMPATAQAHGVIFLAPQISPLVLASLSVDGQCITFTFDRNGNRTGQSSSSVGSGQTNWGAGTFGCFSWQK